MDPKAPRPRGVPAAVFGQVQSRHENASCALAGKPMAISNPVLFLAKDRELAEEAWAGDIIGDAEPRAVADWRCADGRRDALRFYGHSRHSHPNCCAPAARVIR